VAPAPAAWVARVTESLSRQLPAPSVPTRIFLVEQFERSPVSGKIDRRRLPDLADLQVGGAPSPLPATTTASPAPGEPGAGDALAICRQAFESTELGWDDSFAEHGGHSLRIAVLTLRLQRAGWQ